VNTLYDSFSDSSPLKKGLLVSLGLAYLFNDLGVTLIEETKTGTLSTIVPHGLRLVCRLEHID
jgi:hypothetical protein